MFHKEFAIAVSLIARINADRAKSKDLFFDALLIRKMGFGVHDIPYDFLIQLQYKIQFRNKVLVIPHDMD